MFENDKSRNTVLIVEDYEDISDLLCRFLTKNGYKIQCASNGKEASEYLSNEEYLLILMDLMLPYKSGETLIKELRSHSDTPVICLSAKSEMDTRLEVLRMGADDYILKPFDLNEVLVRMETVLRRVRGQSHRKEKSKVLQIDGLSLYCDEQRVEYKGENIPLTFKELQLLKLFMEYPAKTYSKANLYETVWEDEYYYEDNTINVHISNLRKKLKKCSGHDYIDTVWGIGYRLKAGQDSPNVKMFSELELK